MKFHLVGQLTNPGPEEENANKRTHTRRLKYAISDQNALGSDSVGKKFAMEKICLPWQGVMQEVVREINSQLFAD